LDVDTDCISDCVTGHSAALINCWLDQIHERGDVAFSCAALDGSRYRTAAFVAQHDEQRNVQMLGPVFQTSDFGVGGDVSGNAHDKQVTQTLVENYLRRHA